MLEPSTHTLLLAFLPVHSRGLGHQLAKTRVLNAEGWRQLRGLQAPDRYCSIEFFMIS